MIRGHSNNGKVFLVYFIFKDDEVPRICFYSLQPSSGLFSKVEPCCDGHAIPLI